MKTPQIVIIVHNIRSIHNVGSIFRTAEGLGVKHLYLTGYTPYPIKKDDSRLPHLAEKITKQMDKTSLGAHHTLAWTQNPQVINVVNELKKEGYKIYGLEQDKHSIKLPDFKTPDKMALILGNEVEGMDEQSKTLCDDLLEIPMYGQKESFNVVQACAMCLYHCTFIN